MTTAKHTYTPFPSHSFILYASAQCTQDHLLKCFLAYEKTGLPVDVITAFCERDCLATKSNIDVDECARLCDATDCVTFDYQPRISGNAHMIEEYSHCYVYPRVRVGHAAPLPPAHFTCIGDRRHAAGI